MVRMKWSVNGPGGNKTGFAESWRATVVARAPADAPGAIALDRQITMGGRHGRGGRGNRGTFLVALVQRTRLVDHEHRAADSRLQRRLPHPVAAPPQRRENLVADGSLQPG